ncbi:MAG: CoA transferase [bacterium]
MEALKGLTVIDVSGSVATAFCAKQFADYGAEVINLEPHDGFASRREPPFINGAPASEKSALHAYLSTNKLSTQIDQLDDSSLTRLLNRADLLLDDGSPSDRIANLYTPGGGVRASISWYGNSGPYSHFQGTDAQIFALNGMLRSIGRAEGPPMIPTGYQAQFVGGMTAYVSTLGYLLAGELGNTGGPVHLDISIFEAALCFTEVGAVSYYNNGIEVPRMGLNRFPPTYPLGVFACRDGWLGVTVLSPSQWPRIQLKQEMKIWRCR